MTYEETEKVSKQTLKRKVNESLALAETRGVAERPGHIADAEFYMRILEDRRDTRVSIRDFILEIVVILLIGWEIHMSYRAERLQSQNFDKEEKVFTNLEANSSATAKTLTTVEGTMETMNKNTADTVTAMQKLRMQQNDSLTAQQNSLATLKNTLSSITKMEKALEQELNLAFDVSVAIMTNNTARHISIVNQGKTAVSVWGGKLNDDQPTKFDNPKFIVPGTQVEFFLENAFTHLASLVPRETERTFPLEFYLLSADGKPYIVRGVVSGLWEKDQFNLYSTISSIKQEAWPKEVQ
jgi:hypothetical protein